MLIQSPSRLEGSPTLNSRPSALPRLAGLCCLAVALSLGACARKATPPSISGPPVAATLRPYQINGVWYYPKVEWDYDQTGIASWYGDPFHGRKTAIGETYDMNELTAAHKTLQLPTYARVTNLENGRSVVVKVNDRGPYVNNRIIDLSRGAAQLLGFEQRGVAKVRVQVVDAAGRTGTATVPTPVISESERRAVTSAPVGTVTATPLPPPGGARGQTGVAPAAAAAVPTPMLTASLPDPPVRVTQVPVRPSGVYIQAGAFLDPGNAERLRVRLARYGRAFVARAAIDGQLFYRVRIGPLAQVDDADRILDQLIAGGETSARIIVE